MKPPCLGRLGRAERGTLGDRMKLEAFKVQNYKRIEDTGWVPAGDPTVLVGRNKAGKSANLRGVSKLNPSDGEKYDSLKQ